MEWLNAWRGLGVAKSGKGTISLLPIKKISLEMLRGGSGNW